MALGYCAVFGTLLPPLFSGELSDVIRTAPGLIVMGGVGVCLLGIVINGIAGIAKEREVPEEEKKATVKEFSFKKGVWVATFCGIMSACMSYGFAAGKPIAELAVSEMDLLIFGRICPFSLSFWPVVSRLNSDLVCCA